jgi:hypothetical protein
MGLVIGRTNDRNLLLGLCSVQLSVFSKLPSPVGVVASSSNLVFGGVATGISAFAGASIVPGNVYYTNTQGSLINSGLYYGLASSLPYLVYTYTSSTATYTTLISLDSQIGLGVSAYNLYVKIDQ